MNNRITRNIRKNFIYNKEFEAALRQALQPDYTPTDQKHYETTRLLAHRESCRIQKRRRISFAPFLAAQIRFIGRKIWIMQGLFLSVIHALLTSVYRKDQPAYMISLLFCFSVLVLMTALPFLYRSVRYQMQEVESAARFSLVKLLAAKLAMIGIGDLFMLGGIFIIALWETSLPAESIFISLCFPFLLACSGCLFMLGRLDAKSFFVGSMGLCSVLILLAVVFLRHYEALLQYTLSGKWAAVCILLLLVCVREYRYIIYCSSYTEMQLT